MKIQDPTTGVDDTEQGSGNIMNALLQFPLVYTFHVVGRIHSENEDHVYEFVQDVKSIVYDVTNDDSMVLKITPRGTKFTKLTIEAQVENTVMITSIYEQIQQMTVTVMQF